MLNEGAVDGPGSFFPVAMRTLGEAGVTTTVGYASRTTSDGSGELFPVVLAICLLVSSISFSIFVVYLSLRSSTAQDKSASNSTTPLSIDEDSIERAELSQDPLPHEVTFPWKSDDDDDDDVESKVSHPKAQADLPPALLSWHNISCSYSTKSNSGIATSETNHLSTLQNVSGSLRSTELLAIMGPSGGGKSTLLDMLSGRKSLGTLTGHLSILGTHQISDMTQASNQLKNVSAYVPQHEQFFPTQTPFEAVAFFANLKLGREKQGSHYRNKRIGELLDMLGLSPACRARPIGGTLAGGITIRGLSGGERKRLALACALVMEPRILFLDEITSGLDSENALIVIRHLKETCATLNTAAAVVIHQPSIELFAYFDRLLLLSKGRCIFSDRLSRLPQWYTMKLETTMPADYLIPSDLLKQATRWDHSAMMATGRGDSFHEGENELIKTVAEEAPIGNNATPAAFWRFQVIFYRNLQCHYVRNVTNLAARAIIYSMISFIMGLIFWRVAITEDDVPLTDEQARYILGAGLSVAQVSFLLPFGQISTFFYDKKIFASESGLGLYPSWMYSMSQFFLEAWVLVLVSLLQAVVTIPMVGMWNPAHSKARSFLSLVSLFCMNGLTGNAIVLLSSMATFSQDLAFLVASGTIAISMTASGGYVPFMVMPEWIRWIQWSSPIKYSLQAIGMMLFDDTDLIVIPALGLDTPDTATSNLLAMVAMFFGCTIVTILILSRQREVR